MRGATLPGNSTVELRDFARPTPGPGQVLLAMRASTICGSDIRAIYREHLGVGAEAYQGVIAGHEPAGEVVEVGPGVRRLQVGDRVAVYHIAGCGACDECRHGYMIGCHQPSRAAYGWQRDGGHADYLLAEEVTCLRLPDELTFLDGACVACGFGTAYGALLRADVSGNDQLLITGLGPVGLAVGMLGRALGATNIVGTDIAAERLALARQLGVIDRALPAGDADESALRDLSAGGFEVAIDCSGSAAGRLLALQSMRDWGRCVFVGEGGRVDFDVSPLLIHRQVTLHGSWVTSLRHMEELLERLVRWRLHPEAIVTHRFPLAQAAEAYRVADGGAAGKVAITFE
ncbi:MAG TPA: zinc-binding dehydrogenase [Candidatus Limnocylindrales bacterium]|nr:zinc-binding dehydrogenase [Candidatus Limnocylindrales bacterium]